MTNAPHGVRAGRCEKLLPDALKRWTLAVPRFVGADGVRLRITGQSPSGYARGRPSGCGHIRRPRTAMVHLVSAVPNPSRRGKTGGAIWTPPLACSGLAGEYSRPRTGNHTGRPAARAAPGRQPQPPQTSSAAWAPLRTSHRRAYTINSSSVCSAAAPVESTCPPSKSQ